MSLSTTPLHCAGYETQYQEVDVLITQENNAVLMLAQRRRRRDNIKKGLVRFAAHLIYRLFTLYH